MFPCTTVFREHPTFNFQPHLCLDLLVLKATHANLALNQSSELAFACRMWSKMKMRCQAFALGGRPKQEPVEPLRQEPVEADRAGIGLQSTAQTRSSRFQSTEDCRGRDPVQFPLFSSQDLQQSPVSELFYFLLGCFSWQYLPTPLAGPGAFGQHKEVFRSDLLKFINEILQCTRTFKVTSLESLSDLFRD